MKNELETLKSILLGQFISRFSLGDTWDILIGEYCLSAHTIQFEEEVKITKFLNENYGKFKQCVDKEDISKSTIMAANLRKIITQIELDEMKNLKIDFENGSTMQILTNTANVDWQWYINKSGKDPYIDHKVACYWAGEIKTKE